MNIAVIGSGNVAAWLLYVLAKHNYNVTTIFSRNQKTATKLAKKYKLNLINNIDEIDTDIVFIAINDDEISNIAKKFKQHKAIIIHTSGTSGIDALQRTNNCGVFYPLQTLTSKNHKQVQVPIFITTYDLKTKKLLCKIANSVSTQVFNVNDEQRRKLHLSAVITNNFINHLVVSAKKYLDSNELKYEMILPLLKHTFTKLTDKPYDFTQTGPAARGDKKTILNHKNLLKDTDLLKMYNVITAHIFDMYNV